MRIAVDASRTTTARVTGTERYALEIIREIIRQNPSHDITLYFRETPSPNLFVADERVTQRIIPFKRAWTHLRFATAIWQQRPDVTFVPAHTLPFFFPGRAVVTVHDLGYKYFPQAHPFRSRLYLDLTTRHSARRASLVLADSQATADDLSRFYGTESDKVRVVYPGVLPPPIINEDTRQKYGLPERYFIFIGTLQPRKNIARIVEAYAQYRHVTENPAGLVLAGREGWLYDPAWVRGVEGVQITGYIDENDKGTLLANALALIFPTLYEGFGFPVIEAMHCATPVITSTTSSLPELARDAALLVDPMDVTAIADAMRQLAEDEALRDDLRERGLIQAKHFTWERAGQQALLALEEAAR